MGTKSYLDQIIIEFQNIIEIIKDLRHILKKSLLTTISILFFIAILHIYIARVIKPGESLKNIFFDIDVYLAYSFGLITLFSLLIAIFVIHERYNQIFSWDNAFRKINNLINDRKTQQIKMFFWTPLIGGISEKKEKEYIEFENSLTTYINDIKIKRDKKEIDIICLSEKSMCCLYNNYKISNNGEYEDEVVNDSLNKVNEFICKISNKTNRANMDLLPTFYFFLTERKLLILLPLYMPIHKKYNAVFKKLKYDMKEKINLYGFQTDDQLLIKVFNEAFKFYKELANI